MGARRWSTAVVCVAFASAVMSGCGGGSSLLRPTATPTTGESGTADPTPSTSGPVKLAQPIQIHQVRSVTPCATPPSGVPDTERQSCYTLADNPIVLHEVRRLEAKIEPATGQPVVSLDLDPADGKKFADLTSRITGQEPPTNQLAVVVDHVVVTAPAVQGAITGGRVQISGSFTMKSAADLVRKLSG